MMSMLTTTAPPADTSWEPTTSSHIETPLSDDEIFRRVSKIRSTWSIHERVQRRREADRRFEDLLDLLEV